MSRGCESDQERKQTTRPIDKRKHWKEAKACIVDAAAHEHGCTAIHGSRDAKDVPPESVTIQSGAASTVRVWLPKQLVADHH